MSSVLCFLTRVFNGLVSAFFYPFLVVARITELLPFPEDGNSKDRKQSSNPFSSSCGDRALSLGNRRQRAQNGHHGVGGEPHTVFHRALATVTYREMSSHIRRRLSA